MSVQIDWDVDVRLLTDAEVQAAAQAAATHGGRPELELAIVFVSEAFLCDLHQRFLNDPSPTDVISFDLGEGPGPEGEVYVSVDRARIVAQARSISLQRELALYVVHGVLHLCGFDDHEPAERAAMRSAESTVLASLGYERVLPGEHEWDEAARFVDKPKKN